MPDFSDIPDEAWIDVVAAVGWDTRSGLWTQMARAIDALRPPLVVIENVRGLCSAPADSDLEPCPWCVGDHEGVPLRALGAVLGDLADLGYDAQWCGLRAADVGAPHGRFRVFIVAVPSVARGVGSNPAGDGRDERRTEPAGLVRGLDAAVGGAPAAAHSDGLGHERRGNARDGRAGSAYDGQPASDADGAGREGPEPARGRDVPARGAAAPDASAGRGQPWSVASGSTQGVAAEAVGAAGRGCGSPAADPDHIGRERTGAARDGSTGPANHSGTAPDPVGGRRGPEGRDDRLRAEGLVAFDVDWREYEPAIRRWEAILGRPAPEPTAVGARGGRALSPRFVEWLMGLPDGWVTAVPGLSRNQMLKALGNGVCPQQGAAALTYLLTHLSAAAA